MERKLGKILLTTAACAFLAFASTAQAAPNWTKCETRGMYDFGAGCAVPTSTQAWDMLMDGNADFVAGNVDNLGTNSTPEARTALGTGQKPFAIVLTCSDSRVPPEILFNKGLGEIFVIRVAGNIVDPHELGSIEYAVEHLGTNLVVVLGHEKCGAVGAAYGSYPVNGDPADGIGSLIHSIYPAVDAVVTAAPLGKAVDPAEQSAQIEECVLENINLVAESMATRSLIIEEAELAGHLEIVRAKYSLTTGAVELIPVVH